MLDAVYARFFRSLNHDYLRKTSNGYKPDPWDQTPDGAEYPFVELKLEHDITTVAGANESGKTQLLGVVKRALTGDAIERQDFCRYSPYFGRDSVLVLPEFGLRLVDLDDSDRVAIAKACDLKEVPDSVTSLMLFRMNATPKARAYFATEDGWQMHAVRKPTALEDLPLPQYFEIDSRIPLPDAVPLDYLAGGKLSSSSGGTSMRRLAAILKDKRDAWFSTPQNVTASAEQIAAAFSADDEIDSRTAKQYKLAHDLLIDVAGLQPELFSELRTAVLTNNGYAKSIVDTVNDELSKSLNFPHWWSQDSNFELFLELREHDLLFMVRDRTGTSYSFADRSEGLKYFLSYFVQYKSHVPRSDGRPEILLMDEPDAFLSSSGQQDLLRIFEAFARPEDSDSRPIQVLYVTHSPFLIDKNHAGRIRVLEKGEYDEGTRVVANASRNHYEPLRSALGSFVGESAFIGSCNLMLEGASDQVLLAGISSWLRRRGAPYTERLDLNAITLVPAGGASQIPYLAYLARGRDVDRPSVIVLLDGDKPGDDARKILQRGGPRRKQLVNPDFVLQLSDDGLKAATVDNPAGLIGIEDLFPLPLAVDAARRYCEEFVPDVDVGSLSLTSKEVFTEKRDTLRCLESAIAEQSGDKTFHLDKIGFARSVLAALNETADGDHGADSVASNFRLLLSELGRRQRSADREANEEKIRSRINRARKRFEANHPTGARCEHVTLLIEEIEAQLDDREESEIVRAEMRRWTGKYRLNEDPRAELDDFNAFIADLRALPYAGAREVQDE